jgi:hypothetical protein
MTIAHGSNGNNSFLRSTHPLAVWINGLLFVEFVSRLLHFENHHHGLPLGVFDVIRSMAWGLLVLQLLWRWACQYPSMWWALDYVPRLPTMRNGSLWLFRCPEPCLAGAVHVICVRRRTTSSTSSGACILFIRELQSKLVGVCLNAISRIPSQILVYLPFLRRATTEQQEEQEEELIEVGPSQILMEREEIELVDISRRSKQA